MQISEEIWRDKIYGCWAGKCLAGAIGMPYEGVPYQLNLAEKDIIVQDVPNDDLELQLVWLVALERYGLSLTPENLADYWLHEIKHGCDEYSVAIRNIRRGIMPPASGWEDNFFIDGMGGAIRSEVWAAVFPNRPDAAAYFAANDAMVDHWGEGVWAEVFLAMAENRLFSGAGISEAIKFAAAHLPATSRLQQAVTEIFALHEQGLSAAEAKAVVLDRFYSHNFTDCVMNIGFMLYALLWGNGDFIKTILLSVNCGRDTDCTAATCGSFLGICHGSAVIPAQYLRKLSPEITLSECIGKIDTIPKTLPDLLERTAKLRQKFARQLPATRYPLYTPYIPGEPAALDSGRWLILDESEHDITALQEDLLKTGRCPEALHRFIIDTAGLTLDLSAHARNANVLNLFTFLNVENEDEEENNNAVLSATADVGMTLWIDRKKIFNHHSRMRSIPSFHRAEGGAAFNYPLQQGDKKLVHIKLYSCIAPLLCTVMFGNGHNDHLDGYKLKI